MAWCTLLVYTSVAQCLCMIHAQEKAWFLCQSGGKNKHTKACSLGTVKACFKYC